MQASAPANAVVAKSRRHLAWIGIWQFAAVGLGHGGCFWPRPCRHWGRWQHWRLPPRSGSASCSARCAYWRAFAGSTGGLLLGAAGARWHWVRVFIDPAMQLIRAMPVASFVILALLWVRSANLSVIVSFTHVLPVVYAGVLAGHRRHRHEAAGDGTGLPPAASARLRYIWLPGIFPSFCESCIAAMGMCWKSGVSAEVIGLPDHSVGDALYRAKITLSTPDVFAWTLVIVLLSAALSAAAAGCCARQKCASAGRYRHEH